MKIYIPIMLFFMCFGCSVNTVITMPDDTKYQVKSKTDAKVCYKDKDVEITVDNRGQKSGFLLMLPALLQRTPDISVEQDD